MEQWNHLENHTEHDLKQRRIVSTKYGHWKPCKKKGLSEPKWFVIQQTYGSNYLVFVALSNKIDPKGMQTLVRRKNLVWFETSKHLIILQI